MEWMDVFSLFGGGVLRLLPELFSWINKKTDNAHELAMMDRQLEIQDQKQEHEIAHTQLTGDIEFKVAQVSAHMQALQDQMKRTGIWIADVMNVLVRPVITYYFAAMYGLFKLALIITAYHEDVSVWAAIMAVYDDQDRQAFWGILGFWFVGREFGKQNGTASGYHNGQF